MAAFPMITLSVLVGMELVSQFATLCQSSLTDPFQMVCANEVRLNKQTKTIGNR